MKLSDAIRLGAMMKPQAFNVFRNDHGTCALGAASDAVGGVNIKTFPIIDVDSAACPVCHQTWTTTPQTSAGGAAIVHLNDYHRWTREAVADQVEIWEKEFERAQQPQAATVDHVPVSAS